MVSMLCESEHLGKYRCLFVVFTVHNSVDSFRLSLTVKCLGKFACKRQIIVPFLWHFHVICNVSSGFSHNGVC